MFGVFRRILRDKKNSLIAYCIGALATIEMYIALFPAIKDQAEQLNKMLNAFPKAFMEAFGMTGASTFFTTVESYMSTEYFTFFWPIMAITFLISFANLMIVTEVEKGTIELALSQPISRLRLFFSRYFAGVIYFAIFDFVSIFGIILFCKFHHINYQINNYYTVFGMSFLFGLAIFSMAALLSAVFSEKGRATAVSAGILLSMYVVNIVATLKDSLKNLRYASIFYYFNPSKVLGSNEIVKYSVPIFIAVIVILTLTAAIWFEKRDITV